MAKIGSLAGMVSFCFTVSKALLGMTNTLKAVERARSHHSDLETSLENLRKALKCLSETLEADQSFPQLMVCDEQSGGSSSTLEAVHHRLLSPSSISWKTRIGGMLARISSLESYCMNQSSSFERAKALNEISRLAGEIGSLWEILDRGLKKLTYNGSKSELLRTAKRHVSATCYPTLSWGGLTMQLEQQPQPNDTIFGRSLLAETLELRSLNAGWPCSYTASPAAIPGNSFVVRDTAIGMTDVALMDAHSRFGTESDVFASRMIANIGVRSSTYSHDVTVHHIYRSNRDTCLEDWTQNKSCAQTAPCVVPFSDRSATLWVKPASFEWPLFRLEKYGEGVHTPEALLDEIITNVSDPFIGDEGLGPNTGEPNMGREDDDDDDCVGFRRFPGPAGRGSALFHGGERHGRAHDNHLLGDDQRGTIPRFGPPKRDPVAAAIGSTFKRSADETTLAIWRDAIARTCGRNTGFGPMASNKGKETEWKSAWEMHGNARGEGSLMCAY